MLEEAKLLLHRSIRRSHMRIEDETFWQARMQAQVDLQEQQRKTDEAAAGLAKACGFFVPDHFKLAEAEGKAARAEERAAEAEAKLKKCEEERDEWWSWSRWHEDNAKWWEDQAKDSWWRYEQLQEIYQHEQVRFDREVERIRREIQGGKEGKGKDGKGKEGDHCKGKDGKGTGGKENQDGKGKEGDHCKGKDGKGTGDKGNQGGKGKGADGSQVQVRRINDFKELLDDRGL